MDNHNKEMLLQRETEDALYKVLMTEAGRKLVDHLVDRYVYTFIAQPNDTNVAIGIKQGQANLVMMIKKRIELIEKGVTNG